MPTPSLVLDDLSDVQRHAVRLFVAGARPGEVAEVDPATVSRWRRAPAFRAALDVAQADADLDTVADLRALRGLAVATLRDLLSEDGVPVGWVVAGDARIDAAARRASGPLADGATDRRRGALDLRRVLPHSPPPTPGACYALRQVSPAPRRSPAEPAVPLG